MIKKNANAKSVSPVVASAPATSSNVVLTTIDGKVTAQTADEVKQAAMVQGLAIDIIRATGELAGKYLRLCLYIRQEKVSPKLVSYELKTLGFKKSRISEVNRVAHSSDKLFSDYQAKLIGFDRCLELSRIESPGAVATVTKAAQLLVGQGSLTEKEVDDSTASPAPTGEGTPPATDLEKIKRAARTICMLAKSPGHFRFEDSKFEVVIRKAVTISGGNKKS